MFEKHYLLKEIFKYLLRATLAMVLALSIVLFFKGEILQISKSISEQKRTAFILERRSQTIRQLEQDLKVIKNNETLISFSMPSADNVVDFKASLDSIANRLSLQQSVTFGMPLQDQKSIDYSISLTANAVTFLSYLEEFEKLPYLTKITSIDYKPLVGSWENSSLITLKAQVFTKPVSD